MLFYTLVDLVNIINPYLSKANNTTANIHTVYHDEYKHQHLALIQESYRYRKKTQPNISFLLFMSFIMDTVFGTWMPHISNVKKYIWGWRKKTCGQLKVEKEKTIQKLSKNKENSTNRLAFLFLKSSMHV